jgi:ATP phosphoribosyltransferase regulatory subunit
MKAGERMRLKRVQLPEGVRDIIGEEAFAKRRAEARAREALLRCGYEEIETPTFEYAAVFDGIGDMRMENMLHFFDADGRMLTMRPDFTLPSARLVSALRDSFPLPVRVCYIGNAFGLEHNTARQRREFTQAGAELMGMCGAAADAEIILVAHQTLEHMGLCSHILDIGHVGVFDALWRAAGLSRAAADGLRTLLDRKDALEASAYLEHLDVDPALGEQFLTLIDLYGGVGVIDDAKRALTAPGCAKALHDLETVCRMLDDCGLTPRIAIDLGHLSNMDYYTGIVFRAMADGVGSPLLSGGRYDNVLEQFGRPMPATGFAIGLSRVLRALELSGGFEKRPGVAAVVGADQQNMGRALAYAKELRASLGVVITAACESEAALFAIQRETGAASTHWIDGAGAWVLGEGGERRG